MCRLPLHPLALSSSISSIPDLSDVIPRSLSVLFRLFLSSIILHVFPMSFLFQGDRYSKRFKLHSLRECGIPGSFLGSLLYLFRSILLLLEIC